MKLGNIFDLENKKIKIKDIILILLLIFICINQLRIIKLSKRNYYTNLINVNKTKEIDFKKDYDKFSKNINNTIHLLDKMIDENRNSIFNNDDIFKSEEVVELGNKNNLKMKTFRFYPKTEINDKEFTFTMKLPKDFDKSKLNIFFDNGTLKVSFEESKKDKNSSYYSSFTRQFSIDTKAENKDITKNFDNDMLKVVVPIIK